MKEATLKAKEAIVSEIVDKLSRSQSVVIYDYRGLTVAEVTDLRNKMRAANVEYRVLKNTMIKRALAELNITGADAYLEGPTAVMFSYDDPSVAAKILIDFVKAAKKTEIKAGIVGGSVCDASGVKALAELPSKEQLIAKMLGSMNMPITGLVMALSGILRKPLYALNAIKEAKEQQ